MRRAHFSAVLLASTMLLPRAGHAQGDMGGMAMDKSKPVVGGGIMIPGWTGKADATGMDVGMKITDSKLTKTGDVIYVTTGPASTYWNPANKASGNYTVKATFNEPKFQNLMTHPHPYGVFIGGNDMDTDKPSYLYCAAYGNGTYIVRGFGANGPFQMNGRGTADSAVHKAAKVGDPLTQDIAIKVSAAKVECTINGKTVASYDKSALVVPGKLKSTDGIYGIRFAHMTEGNVVGFGMVKN